MWDPGLSSFLLQEDSVLYFRGCVVSTFTITREKIMMHEKAVSSSPFAPYCVFDVTDDENFCTYLASFVHISLTSTSRISVVSHDSLHLHSVGTSTQTVWRPQHNTIPKGAYVPYQTMLCYVIFGKKIMCCDTGAYITQYLPTQHSLRSFCIKMIGVHKCLHYTLDGYAYIPWRPMVKQRRSYPWYSSMKMYHHLWW